MSPSLIRLGIDRLVDDRADLLKGARVGLLCHAASVDGRLRHSLTRLQSIPDVRLEKVFGPEHGIWGVAQDMIPVGGDRAPGEIPIFSLYGQGADSLKPTRAQMEGLDVLVCDLQDVGSRYYTYAWSVLLCLEACAEAGVAAIICDRPNPLGGRVIEGGTIRPGFESFVGLHSVPNRHGLTLGELADLARTERGLSVDLTVLSVAGWTRDQDFGQTGLPWVLPSPNMPSLETAYVYPGMCLVEATALSEGRGTTRPFELVGAPGIDPHRLADALTERRLPGVAFRPTWFRPQFQKHAGRDCGGVQMHVLDRDSFQPLRAAVTLLWTVRALFPDCFAWRDTPYEFVRDIPAMDLLTGSSEVREAIDAQTSLAPIFSAWEQEEARFQMRRAPYLLT